MSPALIAALLIALISAGGSWWVRAQIAETEVADAITAQRREDQKAINHERELRGVYETLADRKLGALLGKLDAIHASSERISREVAAEVASNRQFYDQPLPAKGYEQWMQARALLAADRSSPSASQPLPALSSSP